MDEMEAELREREEELNVLKEQIGIAKNDRDSFIRVLEELKE